MIDLPVNLVATPRTGVGCVVKSSAGLKLSVAHQSSKTLTAETGAQNWVGGNEFGAQRSGGSAVEGV